MENERIDIEGVHPADKALASQPFGRDGKFRKIEEILSVDGGEAIVHNFVGDKMAQYRMTALATGGACQPFEAMPPEGIDLVHWFCHRVEMVAKSGEIITPIRTVLISKSGQAFSFVSDGIARELDTLRSLFGEGPYLDPMKVKVSKLTTARKQTTYTMGPA